jgi:hypothetical protein
VKYGRLAAEAEEEACGARAPQARLLGDWPSLRIAGL